MVREVENMKKIILSCLLCVLMFTGCNNDIVAEDTSITKKEEIIQTTDEENSADTNIVESDTNNLLYREYQSGTKFFAGVIHIAESDVSNLVSDPTRIAVLYNDELYEEIEFTNTDITIEIPKDGNYCFLVVDEDDEITDITDIVTGEATVPEEGGVIPLH